jgi:hypothetical protein
MITSPTSRNPLDDGIDTLAGFAPIAPIVFMIGYAWDRSRAAASDEHGFSLTIQEIFWAVIAVSLVATVGAVIYNAVRDRGTDIGDDISNRQLP